MGDDPTAVKDPNYLNSQSCDWVVDGEECGESPAAWVGEYYYACEDHFKQRANWIESDSAP